MRIALAADHAGYVLKDELAAWLREQGHEVFSVYDEARGMGDDQIIQKASDENWILMTNDKDFGARVYREHQSHSEDPRTRELPTAVDRSPHACRRMREYVR